jgi:hypothetical protein
LTLTMEYKNYKSFLDLTISYKEIKMLNLMRADTQTCFKLVSLVMVLHLIVLIWALSLLKITNKGAKHVVFESTIFLHSNRLRTKLLKLQLFLPCIKIET